MILGLDIGSNSIGWALRSEEKGFIKAGSMIFSEGREAKTHVSLAAARRTSRGQRKIIRKKAERQEKLLQILQENNLFPSDFKEMEALKLLNPYELRAKGASEVLPKYELGRALMHLSVKRGFKSNKKDVKEGTAEKEEKGLKLLASNLTSELQDKTLGQWLYERFKNGETVKQGDITNPYFFATRKHYNDEFCKIKQVHFAYVSEEVWKQVENAIFFQNPLKAGDIAPCSILVFHKDYINAKPQDIPRRSRKAMPSFQAFDCLQRVANIRINDLPLSPLQKEILLTEMKNPKAKKNGGFEVSTFNKNDIAKLFGVKSAGIKLPVVGEESNIKGNAVDFLMKNAITGWEKLSLQGQDFIVNALMEEENPKETLLKCGISEAEIEKMLDDETSNIKPLFASKLIATASLSSKIIHKIIDDMREGLMYHEAMEKAGYNHSVIGTGEVLEKLPYYGEILKGSVSIYNVGNLEEKIQGRLANPTTHVILNNLRKLVNEIIAKYGKPEAIHLELAREIGQGAEGLKQLISEQSKNEKENEKIDVLLIKEGVDINHQNRLKIKLYEELPAGKKLCPYSGNEIKMSDLFTGLIQVDHILPYSKTLDNARSNLCLSFASANLKKGNISPYKAFGEEALRRAEDLFAKNKAKLWRFEANAMKKYEENPDFAAKKLHDTKHATRLAKRYLEAVVPDVLCINGQVTGRVRNLCQFNSILNEESEEGSQNNANEKGKKKNRNDNRHHAVDACLLTFMTRSIVQNISTISPTEERRKQKNEEVILKLKEKRSEIEKAIEGITVFNKPRHKLLTELHDQTSYSGNSEIKETVSSAEFISKFKSGEIDFKDIQNPHLKETLTAFGDFKEMEKYLKNHEIETIEVKYKPNGMVRQKVKVESLKEGDAKTIISPEIRKLVSNLDFQDISAKELNEFADLKQKKQIDPKTTEREYLVISKIKNFLKQGVKKLNVLKPISFTLKLSNGKVVKPAFNHISVFSLPREYNKFKLKERIDFIKKEYGCTIEITKENLAVVGIYKTFAGKFSKNGIIDYHKLKPHPASKLLFKIQTGDSIKALPKNSPEEILFKVSSVSPVNKCFAGIRINYSNTINASGYDIKVVFNDIKTCKIRPVHVDILGNVKDNNKWFEKE